MLVPTRLIHDIHSLQELRFAFMGWPSRVIDDEGIHRNILAVMFLTGITLVALEAANIFEICDLNWVSPTPLSLSLLPRIKWLLEVFLS